MEYIKLNNGVEMPMVGLGTHKIPNDQMTEVIATAYEVGYRKIDTAWLYQNEEVIGKAIRNNNISRDQLFITSKLHIDNLYFHRYHYKKPNLRIRSVSKAVKESCRRLQTDYLDLYLVHWPFPGFVKMYEDVLKLQEKGIIKTVGVSSFLPAHLEQLEKASFPIPAVNQFEINPLNSQIEETLYNQNKGIHVEAYASFGTTRATESASNDILGNEDIIKIGEAHGKTPSQVVLRWTVQRGISVIPRSKSRKHLADNLDIFDFSLSDEEMECINALNQNRYSRSDPHKE